MIPILYATITEGTVPNDYGIGALTDCLSCEVKEERNGAYELSLSYASGGIHADEIQVNRFIIAKPNFTDSNQIFRIYKVGKVMNGRFSVSAQHISYDLSGKVITSGTASSASAACALLETKAGNFTITTDKTTSASFKITEPSSVRSWFGGKQGSLLDVFGTAEWYYNNYACSLKVARGQDRGVTIRYGKNLTELSQEVDMSNLATGIYPYYVNQDGVVTCGTKVATGLTLDVDRDIAVNFSQDVNPESSTPILTQLSNLATNYKNSNNFTVALNKITLDFVQLKELTERVDLCDTVHIYFEALGISTTAKCISTTWDVINERYTSTSFGDARTNIADTIATTQKLAENAPSSSYMQQAIAHATELITGNLGGYVVLHDSNGDGEPDEILIMNTADIATATQVWRWNKNGLGYATSYAGPYDTVALTADGKINASAITAGTLNANLIKAGVISDVNNRSSINMTSGEATLYNLRAKNSFQLRTSSNAQVATLGHISDGTRLELLVPNLAYSLVDISAYANNAYIHLNNNSNKTTFAAGLGICSVNDSNGNERCSMKVSTVGDGVVSIENNSNTETISLSGQTGNVRCVSLTQTSSRKVKENIKPIEDAEKILELDAVSFDYKDKNQGVNKRGFIAEDVAEVLPNLVTPETETTPATLDYIGIIPYLQAVIKKQEERIKALEDKLNGTN